MIWMNSIVEAVVSFLSNSLLPGLMLTLLLVVLFKFCRNVNATTKYALWYGCLIALLVTPLLANISIDPGQFFAVPNTKMIQAAPEEIEISPSTFPLDVMTPPSSTSALLPTEVAHETEAILPTQTSARDSKLTLPSALGFMLLALWGLGVMVGLLILTRSLKHLNHLKRTAKHSLLHQQQLHKLLSIHNIRRSIQLMTSSKINAPVSLGFIRPMILIPNTLIAQLTPEELNYVLLHEIAHLKRRDDWAKLLQKLIRTFLFFHPGVWWIDRQLDLEREVACDDWVAQLTNQRRSYASCLLRLAEIGLHHGKASVQLGLMMASKIEVRIKKLINAKRFISTELPRFKLLIGAGLLLVFSLLTVGLSPNITVGEDSTKHWGINTRETHNLELAPGTELVLELPRESIVLFRANLGGTTNVVVENMSIVLKNHSVRFQFIDENMLIRMTLPQTLVDYIIGGHARVTDKAGNPVIVNSRDDLKDLNLDALVAISSFKTDDVILTGSFNAFTGPSLAEATSSLMENPVAQTSGTVLIRPLDEIIYHRIRSNN